MNSIILALVGLILYLLAYKFYATFISKRILRLDPDRETPSHKLRDDIDYVPTNKYTLFGHHYASIAGVAPIVGPAIAVIWGWLPALLWIVFGTILNHWIHRCFCFGSYNYSTNITANCNWRTTNMAFLNGYPFMWCNIRIP